MMDSPDPSLPPAHSAQEKPLRILVADDDRDAREALSEILKRNGYEIEVAADGSEAMAMMHGAAYDIVLTDLKMPGADGIEVLRAAAGKKNDCLVILITGFASLETALQAIRHGAYDYLTKPFRMDELLLVVRNAAERVGLVRQNRRLMQELEAARRAFGQPASPPAPSPPEEGAAGTVVDGLRPFPVVWSEPSARAKLTPGSSG
ncbi:MAG: response regulator [Nitrospirota bacterium]|jgi:DNA-binding NtrC family response regulator